MNQYEFHYDSGHGWLKVEKIELTLLGIAAEISGCSYAKGEDVYLEEDCDAGIFDRAKKKVGDFKIKSINDGDNSIIREYASYRGGIS